jgi:light-regulated signal transduction histidine kinase (bacteriophytochrome)
MQGAEGDGFCRTSVTDVSEKKRAEEALQKLHDNLERLVEERTKELAAEVVERTRAEGEARIYAGQLERSNKELQDFAFVASHDLQEPIRKVQAFGGRLMEKLGAGLDDEGRDYFQRMMGAAKRMSEMIQSLLDYSRVTTRAEKFRRVDLTQLVREVVSDLQFSIEESGGRIEVGDLPEVEADPSQLDRLFRNLIGNALKFHNQEPPLIRIRTELPTTTSNEGIAAQCRILVEDNGIGFEEKHLDRIFVLFQRLHGRGEYEGSGMGLSICRKIVERHGGTITAKSKPGEGSTFIVTLPLTQPD